MVRRRYSECFAVCIILCAMITPALAHAENTLVPFLSLTGAYDDNLFFSRSNTVDDFLVTVAPGITWEHRSELLTVKSSNIVEIDRYLDEKDLDTEKYDLALEGVYRFLPRWEGSWLLSYIKDTTLDRELQEETGFLIERSDRERYEAGGGISYEVSPVSSVGATYSFTGKDYESETLVDFDRHLVGLSYSRKLKTQSDTISVLPTYSSRDSDLNTIDEYSLGLAWDHNFSPIWKLHTLLGVRYDEIDFKRGGEDIDDWGVIVDAFLRRIGRTSSLTIGLRRDTRVTGRGTPVEVDRLYFRTAYSLTERLEAGFFGQLFVNRRLGESFSADSRYFELRPTLGYNITRNHKLILSYRYSNDYEEDLSDRTADRNEVWLTLNLTFPKKF